MRILKEITCHPEIRRQITLMGGIEPTITILSEPLLDLQLSATETLANLTQFRKARNIFRRHGGIPRLVDLLDVDTAKVVHTVLKCRNFLLFDLNFRAIM